jgi:hypothetical protein
MMKMKTAKATTGLSHMNGGSAGGGGELEVRPGGMLVQKRDPDSDRTSIPPPTIRIKVKYGSAYHEINISSQATFGKFSFFLFLCYFPFLTCLESQIFVLFVTLQMRI